MDTTSQLVESSRRPATFLVSTNDMSREDWLEWRKRGIGGSDAAAVAGVNRWKSPLMVYLDKIGQSNDTEAGEAAYWGTVLEAVVADEFVKRTGLAVRRRNAILASPEYPWMLANLDRVIVGKHEGFEAKTTSAYKAEEWENNKVPVSYMLQVQHYMAVTGFDAWHLAVLIGGQKFHSLKIDRDEDTIDFLVRTESAFWHNHILANVPPPMDGSEASGKLLNRLYPESLPGSIELPSNALELVTAFEDAKANEKLWSERKDQAANQLKSLLGSNELGVIGTNKVSWKTINSNRVDTKLLQKKYPDIYADVCKVSSSRRFEVEVARD